MIPIVRHNKASTTRLAKRVFSVSALVAVFLISSLFFASCGESEKTSSASQKPAAVGNPSPVAQSELDALADGLYAVIETNKGSIVCSLAYKKVPLTVANFVGLAEGTIKNTFRVNEAFYDGLTFHRVDPGFVIQGGDPNGNGQGGPGYAFANEIDPSLSHAKEGTLAMANSGENTNGSQFYITLSPQPDLDGSYSVFGQVVIGMDAVKKIVIGDQMIKVWIFRKGNDAKAFKTDQVAFDALKRTMNEKTKAEIAQKEKEYEAWVDQQIIDQKKLAEPILAQHTKGPDGIYYTITKKGTGAQVATGQTVQINYTLKAAGSDTVIDQNEVGTPVGITVGQGRVFPGLEKTLLAMKVGEKRTAVIPPDLAYGRTGAGENQEIPPGAYIIIEIEVLSAE